MTLLVGLNAVLSGFNVAERAQTEPERQDLLVETGMPGCRQLLATAPAKPHREGSPDQEMRCDSGMPIVASRRELIKQTKVPS